MRPETGAVNPPASCLRPPALKRQEKMTVIQEKSSIDWTRFAAMVQQAKRFLLTAHVRPDGDCIGSELAMAAMLRQLGKEVRILNVDQVPPDLKFLENADKIEFIDTFHDHEWLETVDLLMVLDTLSWAQLGRMKPFLQNTKGKIVVIDHHAKGDEIDAEIFSDTHAEATGRLVFEAAAHLHVTITPAIATALYVAIATDTGWFRFSSVTAKTHQAIAKLVEAGAVPHVVYNHLYERESIGKIRLVGKTLSKVEPFLDGKLMFTSILLDDFAASGAIPSDSEDIINQTLRIGGTEMAIIVVEQQTGGFKISFRSRCPVDCSQVAAQFGGGGHRQASGAFQKLPLEELKHALIRAMIEAYKNIPVE